MAATAVSAGLYTAAIAQEPAEASSSDAFNIPDNIIILNREDAKRRATATVNGTIITGTDVDQRVALIIAANEAKPSADEVKHLRLQVLRNLIDETLQIQEADAQEIGVSDDEVNSTYNRLSSERFRRSDAEMTRYLGSIGSSPASLKRQIKGELAWDRLLRRNVAPYVNVSEGEVNELFERLQASKGTAEYRIGEIYLSATPATRDAVNQNARRIMEQLRAGGSFVAYARQFSEASTAAVGGDLGWIRIEQLQNQQLENVARELQPGQLVGPVEIPGGFSILYLIDKRQVGMADPRDALLSLKQISLDFPAGISKEDAQVRAKAFADGVGKIRGCGEAESVAATLGAQVVSNDGIAIRSLPEALQPILLDLSVGQATPPFGTLEDGVRVLLLCGRDDPAGAAGPDTEALMSQLEDERINRRAQRYLRDLRRDAVIEYN
ncbi:MAG: peptidylprolyl isomerase [Porphyrobacter sp.]|nr:peptidylprolyl isomerase [Porphyrobacter sp.]